MNLDKVRQIGQSPQTSSSDSSVKHTMESRPILSQQKGERDKKSTKKSSTKNDKVKRANINFFTEKLQENNEINIKIEN